MKKEEMKWSNKKGGVALYIYIPSADKRMVSNQAGMQNFIDGTDGASYEDVHTYEKNTLGACAEEWIAETDSCWWFSQINGPWHTEDCKGRD